LIDRIIDRLTLFVDCLIFMQKIYTLTTHSAKHASAYQAKCTVTLNIIWILDCYNFT